MRSRYLSWLEGRYTVSGPWRRPTLAQRIHRYLAWLLGGEP